MMRATCMGTTEFGGPANAGSVYKIDSTGRLSVLYSFGGVHGNRPLGGVIHDSAGNLYGTTYRGGTANMGLVYMLDPSGHQTVLHHFAGGPDGAHPRGGVIRDSAGNLYGITQDGGTRNRGVVYKVDAAGHETVLTQLHRGRRWQRSTCGRDSRRGRQPLRDYSGGGASNAGVVYKLDPAGNETVLYSFTAGADGAYPYGGVIRDAAGNLYGTTAGGGGFERRRPVQAGSGRP